MEINKGNNITTQARASKFKFAGIFFVSAVIIAGLLYYFSDGIKFFILDNLNISKEDPGLPPEDIFKGFSKLVIPAAYADDNFSLAPEQADSTGVSADSGYILKSKEELSAALIKESLRLEPEINYKVKEISKKEWRIIPEDEIEANTVMNIALNATYVDESGKENDREYSWAFQVRDSFKVLHSIPRQSGTNVPVNTGIEITFSHENFMNYGDYFSISPAVDGAFEVHGRTLVFVPQNPFNGGSLYTVKVKAGLPLKDSDEKLEEDYEFTFETRPADNSGSRNWIGVYDRMIEVNTTEAPLIQVSSYQAPDRLEVALFQFKDGGSYLESIKERDNLPWWSYAKEDFLLATDALFKVSSFQLEVLVSDRTRYIEFPDKLDKGFYLAEIENGDEKIQVWIQSSDLAAYTNITKTDSIVWVNRSGNGGPVAGAQVEIMGTGPAVKTNNQGIALFPTPAVIKEQADDSKDNERHYLKISYGDDEIYLPASKLSRSYSWNNPALSDDYWIYMYTDRPRYQSSDVIKYWGVLKDREGDKINEKVTIVLYKQGYVDYYYQPVKIAEKEISLSELAAYSGEIKIENLKPDYYTLELLIGESVVKTKYLSVNPYTKPAYTLDLIPDKKFAYAGEEVKFKASASFFEGTPVPDLNLVFTSPDGERKIKTDENGEADLSFTRPYNDCTREYGCWPDYGYFYIEPENSELAEIKADASIRFYGPNVYMDTKTIYPGEGEAEIEISSRFYDLEKMSADNWWEKNQEDKPAPDIEIRGEMYKITYTKRETGTHYDFINKRTYKSYQYIKNEAKIEDVSFRTDGQGKYIFQHTVEPETTYRIDFKLYDSQGRFDNYTNHLYYYNGTYVNQYSGWQYNYYHFELPEDKTGYHIGETVKAKFVKNDEPMPEQTQGYLFLQLQSGLREYSLGDNGRYEFVFGKDDVPNINLVGVYFNGRNYINTHTSYYGRSVNYDINDSRLKIMAETDKESYAPGENVRLDIRVVDDIGRPVKAEVNLNLVDEAYYAIAGDSASPLETIYANVGPGSLFSRVTHESLAPSNEMAEKGGCFTGDTEILMADGSLKKIEKIKVGDKISTYSDPFGQKLDTGIVSRVWEHQVGEYLIINNNLKVTPEHQMYSNYRFVDAGLLSVGDWLLDYKGRKVFIDSIESERAPAAVYNLEIDPQHTYFAGGFYVHNQEKGAGAREFFTDAALFQVINTDSSGYGNTTFKLPDNITSWRVTAQAVTKDLDAGVSVTKIPVSLPVFAEVTIGSEYLASDKPIARLRAFGTALKNNDEVNFSLSSDSLNIDKNQELASQAFASAYFQLPDLVLGRHDITYSLRTDKGNDAIKIPLTVINSRLSLQEAINNKLTAGTVIVPPNDLPFAVVLADNGQNRLYAPLMDLSWAWGDRIDQKFVRKEARVLINKYYNEEYLAPDFSAPDYQLDSGGMSLLPYSGEDLELSLRVAQLGAADFDREALAQYFFKIFENQGSTREEITYSLCGLAVLGKPVLPRVEAWLERDDLGPKEKIYLALALAKIGAKEKSRQLYYRILENHAEVKEPHVIIRVEGLMDDTFAATALTSVLAAELNAKEAPGMFDYLVSNQVLYGLHKNSEYLFNLEKLDYIKSRLPRLKPGPAKIVMEMFGNKKEVELTGGKIYSFQLSPKEAPEIKFLEVSGDVDISLRYTKPVSLDSVKRDNTISINREYYVNGRKTDRFSEKDMVEVRLYPKFSNTSLQGYYQITDILPSGLMPVAKLHSRNQPYDCHYWYPYNRDGQMVKYKVERDWRNSYCGGDYIKYYAKAKNRGVYTAEPAIIQSFINPDFINYSAAEAITITE